MTLVGSSQTMFAKGVRLAPDGQYLRDATADGLVGLDMDGAVVPGLAERWIVTDDGRSYIFRLADRQWPDGSALSGENVREALRRALASAKGTSLGLDLAKISEVRAMAGRVVEVRLTSPMPEFLQLLARPELALFHKGKATGRMLLARDGVTAVLTPVPPELLGRPADPGWKKRTLQLQVASLPAAQAIDRFNRGETDVVLGGQFDTMPVNDTGPLSRGTVRLDNVQGLFGLQVMHARGALGDPAIREALAMAIDRDALVEPFNVGGWAATTRIVPPGLAGDLGTIGERWSDLTLDQRRSEAARRIASWKSGAALSLSIAMPKGAGADKVFAVLRDALARIGVKAVRKDAEAAADLRIVDNVARIADARWFLNQFNCRLKRGLCSPEADKRVAESVKASDTASERALLAEAEAELTAMNAYIPFGAPLRWSLVRGNVAGFASNRLGFHPLLPFAIKPK
jgi:ABC-type transport system substrate-binding protein